MKFICEAREISPVSLVGGKGGHLQKLVSWEVNVPPFFVVTTESFRYFRKHHALPEALKEKFETFLERHPKIALRSSMISEDHADSSFAGLFETLLDVTNENWQNSLQKIFESVESPRVLEYIEKKNLQIDLVMAVVAQELIEVEKSGVLFSRSPVPPTSAVAIDAAFGMGEGVVSGLADVDNYLLTRTKEIIEIRRNNKTDVLSEAELGELVDLAIHLEEKAGSPSDIEWGYKNGKLYLFQIRPITRTFDSLVLFVDTNLSESYPGVVSPFTGAFVKKAYENVFTESAMIMGAHGDKLKSLKGHYKDLISSVDDHLYYNLEHYYAILRALPGGEKNIENWHKMIGGKIENVSVPFHDTRLTSIETVQTIISLLKLALNRKRVFPAFLTRLEVMKGEIESETKNLKDPHSIIHYLNELINRPIGFGFTVVNDVFIMMGLGYLSGVIRKKGLKEDLVIDLLKTSDGVDSTKPLEHFNDLVLKLSDDFISAFTEIQAEPGIFPYEEIFRKLAHDGWKAETSLLQEFLSLYGDRSFEELKLESLPLKNNPALLKELILWAKKNPSNSRTERKSEVSIELSFIGKKILKFTRESIAMREATRLWRGKYYHLLRQLVLTLSHELKKNEKWRICSIYDFFSLTPKEWQTLSEEEALRVIRERKEWQTKKKNYPEIIQWVETEPLPAPQKVTSTGELSGQGVSPGITEGKALVLENPLDALHGEHHDYILVTKNTDPAWVYIMSRSQGLISEKGSLLSHTAIIGRELNIPTIVGVRHATQNIKTGDRLKIDAFKGTIEIL